MKPDNRDSYSLNLLRYRKKELIKNRQYDNQREIIAETIRTSHGTSMNSKTRNNNNILKMNRIKCSGISSSTYLGLATTVLLWVSVIAAYYNVNDLQAYIPWIYVIYIFEAIYSGSLFYQCRMLNVGEFKNYIQSVRLTAPILDLKVKNMSNTDALCKFSRWYDHTNVPIYKLENSNIEIIQVVLKESWHSLNSHTTNKIELQKMKYINKYNKNNNLNIAVDDVEITCRIEKLNHVYVYTKALVSDHQAQYALLIQYKALVYTLLSITGLSLIYRIWMDKVTARITLVIDKTVVIDK